MGEFDQSVMVALLPTSSEWCHIELPHLTLVYAGEIPDIPEMVHSELLKAALLIAMTNAPSTLAVTGTEIFGDENKVDVIRLFESVPLKTMRLVVRWWDQDKYPFNPHVTVGPVGSLDYIPQIITFDRVLVSWGTKQDVYHLTRQY